MWNKDQVCEIYGGQNEDAPIAGPPPLADRKRRNGLLPVVVVGLNIVTLCAVTAVVLDRKRVEQNHTVEIPVVKIPAVEPKAEPVILVQAPKPRSQAEPAPMIPAPAVEPEPTPRRRDRILAVEPEPVHMVKTPAVEPVPVVQAPEPVRQVQTNGEENYWHDDRVYDAVFRFYGNVALVRQPLIEFRKTLPSGMTMWSERGPGRSVDIHIESDQERKIDLPVASQMMVSQAAQAGGCDVRMDIIRDSGPKPSESLSHSTATARSPGAFLTGK